MSPSTDAAAIRPSASTIIAVTGAPSVAICPGVSAPLAGHSRITPSTAAVAMEPSGNAATEVTSTSWGRMTRSVGESSAKTSTSPSTDAIASRPSVSSAAAETATV